MTIGSNRTFALLLGYHALVLVGAAALVGGYFASVPLELDLGLALVTAGIGLQAGLLVSEARRIRSAPSSIPRRRVGEVGRLDLPTARAMLCPFCGWSAVTGARTCPRCARVLVRSIASGA